MKKTKTKQSRQKRRLSVAALLLALLMLFSSLPLQAFAALTEGSQYSYSTKYVDVYYRTGDWQTANGHTHNNSGQIALRNLSSGEPLYCIQIYEGCTNDAATARDIKSTDLWYYELTPTAKEGMTRVSIYGYDGSSDSTYGYSRDAAQLATEILLWEFEIGARTNYSASLTSFANNLYATSSSGQALLNDALECYKKILEACSGHQNRPSFSNQTVTLKGTGSSNSVTLTDSNNVLSNFTVKSTSDRIHTSVNGNKLTVYATGEGSLNGRLIFTKKNTDVNSAFALIGANQTLFYGKIADPVTAPLTIELSSGRLKLVKTSENGQIEGIKFTVTGNNYSKVCTTNSKGEFELGDLSEGKYVVTEETKPGWVPQEPKEVTIVSGQTTTVNFDNRLRRGDLTVTKTSEDGYNEGVKFHLYGTSLVGIKVDEYAVTGSNGKATFKDILIGSNYTLEEVDTNIRYVVQPGQKATIEWNKVTNKSVNNILKKFRVKVVKSDIEKGAAQGDASLAGAVYGLYKGKELMATYTTDANASFTTDYFPCGTDWTIREISASEGYLVSSAVYKVGADPKLYEVEHNTLESKVTEQVIKGNISIIKHTDDGSTQIETPEQGAEFQIYLKSAGSYANADKDEKDTIVCDADGFASSKLLPYGVYTVHQTKGWDGRELIADFDVFIQSDNQTYKFLINNSNFESYLKVVKVDSETGRQIAYAGAGFEIYDAEGHRVTMQFTYPEVTEIHTFYTNSEGYLITPEKLPYGDYTLVEVQAPYGYVLDSTPIPFSINQENSSTDTGVTVVMVKAKDAPQKGVIEITKTGEIFSSVSENNGLYTPLYKMENLEGAVFQIYAAEDIVTPDGTVRANKGELVDEITTADNGIAKSKELYLGKYTVIEKTAPETFVNNKEQYDVELTYAGQEVSVTSTALSVYNERQKATVSLSKIMEQNETFGIGNNNEILSVQFGVYSDEDIIAADGSVIPKDSLIYSANCDKNGNITFNCDLPIGFNWYVKEIAVDEHYILSNAKYEFSTEYQGQDVKTVEINLNDGKPIENKLIYGSIKGLKIDRETEKPVEGALFGLFRNDETEFTEENAILTAASDKDGIFSFDNVPFGEWCIRELKPAEGYLPNTEIYTVQINSSTQLIELTVVNDKVPEIHTTASVDGKKETAKTGEITITDTVSYKHLVPDTEYVLKGILMDKSTGKPFEVNGKTVTSEVKFVPKTANGTVDVEFKFDSSGIKKTTELVVFETLYKDNVELAAHAEINDVGQTVTITRPELKSPKTGADDASSDAYAIVLSAGVAFGAALLCTAYKRKKLNAK